MRASDVRVAVGRVRVATALLLAVFALLALRAAHLAVVDERGVRRGLAQTRRVLTLAAERGAIYDRSGAELALSVDAPSVYALPGELGDLDAAARALARVLALDPRQLAQRLRAHPRFVFLARWVSPEQARRVADLDLRGVGLLDEPRRVYPHGQLAAAVLGFANIDGVGVRGIEQQEEDWLRGTARRLPVERDAHGRLLVEAGAERWATTGGDVALTIDVAFQADAEAALRAAVQRTGARSGVVISLDPASGDVLAVAEAPGFDPNRFRELDYATTRSRAFLDASEPGSTLKAFLVAAALESEAVARNAAIDCENGSFRVPGKTIRDHRPYGLLTPGDVLRVSSNIGAVKIAHALGPSAHFALLRRFGFGDTTGSDFPDESAGLLRSWRSWQPVDHATIAFGQGVSVTAVQLAAATAALANGGRWLEPRLVAARRANRGAWRQLVRPDARRVVGPETAAVVLHMLEAVASSEGTARLAMLRGVRVAGKTGTAQKFDSARGRYAADRFTAWFIGVVPAEAPRLVIVAGLDEPRRPAHTGGTAAAPLFARVAAAQLARYGIATAPVYGDLDDPSPPAPTRVAVAVSAPSAPAAVVPGAPAAAEAAAGSAAAQEAPEFARLHDRVLLPDFRGLSVLEVKQITARGGLNVEISGRGVAIAQDPPPGTVVVVRGRRVKVRFEPPERES